MAALQNKYALDLVVTCELFPRYKTRNITPDKYEHKRKIVNHVLSVILDDKQYLKFWKHLRLINSPLKIIGRARVHLSALGTRTRKFYRSLRLAVLPALDIVRV